MSVKYYLPVFLLILIFLNLNCDKEDKDIGTGKDDEVTQPIISAPANLAATPVSASTINLNGVIILIMRQDSGSNVHQGEPTHL